MNETLKNKIAAAQVLGTTAFKNGKIRVAAHDEGFMELIRGMQVGEGASHIGMAWIKGWTLAQFAAIDEEQKTGTD